MILSGLFVLLVFFAPGIALSADGVLEINQLCVASGCFDGDLAGFPVTIGGSAGKSYALTSDLTVSTANTTAILASGSGVTVDLRGFQIAGPNSCTGIPASCTLSGTGDGVRLATYVRNGSIIGMGRHGVSGGSVENVRASQNGGVGIFSSESAQTTANVAYLNGGDGILTGHSNTVSTNSAFGNGGNGFSLGSGTTVNQNTAARNGLNGYFEFGGRSTVQGNTAYRNLDSGFFSGTGDAYRSNTAYQNGDGELTDHGITCITGCSVRSSTLRDNDGFGLKLTAEAAYSHNAITINSAGPVNSGVDRGNNFCDGAATPDCL